MCLVHTSASCAVSLLCFRCGIAPDIRLFVHSHSFIMAPALSSLVLLLSASCAFASISSRPLASAPAGGDSNVLTHISTVWDTDVQCRTAMTTSYTGDVSTITSTLFRTKHPKHSRSVFTPPVSTIYRDVATTTVDTTTQIRTKKITLDAKTDTVSNLKILSVDVVVNCS